jgi:alpha-1,6-mannosyltransferase
VITSSRTEYIVAPIKYQLQSRACSAVIQLILFGVISTLLYVQLLRYGDLRGKIPEFLLCYVALSIIYLAACGRTGVTRERSHIWLTLGFGLLFRLILLFGPPSLSDDIYRYAWEGYLQTKGVNPYRFPPEAAELANLRNEIWERVNNKDASAIYPPLLQALHAGIYWIFGSIWGYKLTFIGIEALLVWILLKLLRIRDRNTGNIIFYVWNPLVVVETAGSGHHEVCSPALLFGGVLFCLTGQHRKSVFLLASSVLCKLYPILGLPSFVKRIPAKHFVWFPLILAGGYLPYASAGSHLFSALQYYREKWRFNGFLFHQLSAHMSDEKTAESLLFLGVALLLTWCVATKQDLLEQLFWLTGTMLLCIPTLFPWYLLWLVPFLCFFPNPAWLLLTCLTAFSYYILIDWWTLGVWRQSPFFMQLQYYPFYVLLLLEFLWRRTRKPRGDRKV